MEFSVNSFKGKRAILYARVSTDEQAQRGYSLKIQKEQLTKYCQERELEIVAFFQEDASAKTFDRPEFKKILKLLETNKNFIDYLLIVKWDRFSRNISDAYTMIDKLHKMGVFVNATEQWVDPNIPEQQFLLAFYVANSQVENQVRSNRVASGLRKAMKEGRWVSKPPKGYKLAYEESGRSMIVPNEEASFLLEGFQRVAENSESCESILRGLIQKGFNCSKSRFYEILSNPVYMGKIFVPPYKEEKSEFVNGTHEAIIPESLFYQVKDVLNGKKKVQSKPENHFPLKGFLVCQICETFLTASISKGHGGKYPYYHCPKNTCSRFPAKKIHEAIIRFLRGIKVASEIATLYYAVMGDLFKSQEKDKNLQKSKMDKEISELKNNILKLELKFASDAINRDTFQRVKEVYDRQLCQMTSKKIDLDAIEGGYPKYLAFGLSFLTNLDFYYQESTLDAKRRILGSIVPGKLIFDGQEVRTYQESQPLVLIGRFCKDLEAVQSGASREFSRLVSCGASGRT